MLPKIGLVVLLSMVLAGGFVPVGFAQEQGKPQARDVEGRIKSITIDKSSPRAGSGEATLVVAKKTGGEVTVALRPGTSITRGQEYLRIEDLQVGDDVEMETIQPSGAATLRVTTVDLDDNEE